MEWLGPILMVLLALAGTMIVDGWLGRMRDKHPHCRTCGYDLVATPESSDRCSECGSPLSQADAITWGTIERNWPRLWIGVGLLLTTITALIVALSRPTS